MADTPQARLILPEDLTRDEYRSIALAHGWVQHHVYDEPDGNYEEIWATPDQKAALHYIEDPRIAHERFLLVRSHQLRSRLPDITRAFRTLSTADICKTILDDSQGSAARIRALTRLGLIAFERTPEIVEAWQAGLFDSEEQVRMAAVRAMSFIASPDFLSVLDEIAAGDPSTPVRHEAEFLADSIRRHAAKPPV